MYSPTWRPKPRAAFFKSDVLRDFRAELEERTLEIFAEAGETELEEKRMRENDEEIRRMERVLEFTEMSCGLGNWDGNGCESGGLERAMEELLVSFLRVGRL